MTNTIIHIDIDAIDERLDHGKRWITDWGDWNSPHGKTCLHGAIRHCQPVPGDAHLIEQVADCYGFGTSDNDDESSWAAVKATIVVDITDDMLAGTFGPNWEPIVALVRRAASLTADEAKALRVTWDAAWALAGGAVRDAAWGAAHAAAHAAAWGAAGDAAWGAAGDAAGHAVRGAAWDATGDAAWGAAWGATRDATWALVVRDLIGHHGFTQDHYDALTGPWAAAIGKVHPDDVGVN